MADRLAALLAIVLVSAAMLSADEARPPALIRASGKEIRDAVRKADARAVVVNVWATWCIPCREEFPELLRLRAGYEDRGVAVLLVSADFSDARAQVEEFLTTHRVDFPSYLKSGPDMEFIDAFDTSWSGALPATFVFDRGGTLRQSFLRKVSYAELERAVREVAQLKEVS